MRGAAKLIPPVDQRQMLGNGLEIESPIERRVAAARNYDMLSAEIFHLAHGIDNRRAFISFYARDGRFLWLKRPASRRDDNAFAFKVLASARAEAEQWRLLCSNHLQTFNHLIKVESGMERLDLLQQSIDEALARNFHKSWYVVNRLFGIKLGALPAGPWQNIDKMRFNVEKTQLEHGEKA